MIEEKQFEFGEPVFLENMGLGNNSKLHTILFQ